MYYTSNSIYTGRNYSTALSHHGVIGMKWGVRRYQNEDGTLTEEGRKRYSSDRSAYTRSVASDAKAKFDMIKSNRGEYSKEEYEQAKLDYKGAKKDARGAKSADRGEMLSKAGYTATGKYASAAAKWVLGNAAIAIANGIIGGIALSAIPSAEIALGVAAVSNIAAAGGIIAMDVSAVKDVISGVDISRYNDEQMKKLFDSRSNESQRIMSEVEDKLLKK